MVGGPAWPAILCHCHSTVDAANDARAPVDRNRQLRRRFGRTGVRGADARGGCGHPEGRPWRSPDESTSPHHRGRVRRARVGKRPPCAARADGPAGAPGGEGHRTGQSKLPTRGRSSAPGSRMGCSRPPRTSQAGKNGVSLGAAEQRGRAGRSRGGRLGTLPSACSADRDWAGVRVSVGGRLAACSRDHPFVRLRAGKHMEFARSMGPARGGLVAHGGARTEGTEGRRGRRQRRRHRPRQNRWGASEGRRRRQGGGRGEAGAWRIKQNKKHTLRGVPMHTCVFFCCFHPCLINGPMRYPCTPLQA